MNVSIMWQIPVPNYFKTKGNHNHNNNRHNGQCGKMWHVAKCGKKSEYRNNDFVLV